MGPKAWLGPPVNVLARLSAMATSVHSRSATSALNVAIMARSPAPPEGPQRRALSAVTRVPATTLLGHGTPGCAFKTIIFHASRADCILLPSPAGSGVLLTSPIRRVPLSRDVGHTAYGATSGGRSTVGRARRAVLAAAGGMGGAPAQQAVVVVESPTKAKKIQGFLGDQYKVLASYGHVRDLPPRDGSVLPDHDFAMSWQLSPAAAPRLAEIEAAAAGSPLLLLATDPDREGEAISWHIEEELRRRGVLQRVGSVRRITFTEITKSAITAALAGGRQVSQPLVDAYLARRALDYLVGFHLSPVLWRKLPGARSAGRVQSVALRLVCEREAAIERFSPTPYWSITAALEEKASQHTPRAPRAAAAAAAAGAGFTARLTHVDGRRLGVMAVGSAEEAEELARRIRSGAVVVSRVSRRRLQRHPAPPFTTSSLQQEASRRLGFGAARTMRLAQQLYEGAGTGEGLITYMRTDGVSMSAEAVQELRSANAAMYGAAAVPPQPRQYKSRAKNAQEAHEAIRPTRPASLPPSRLHPSLDPDLAALYDLIWRRAVASQMSSAVYEVVTVELAADGGRLGLRASGSALVEPGFLAAYADLPAAADEEGEEAAAGQGRGRQRGQDGEGEEEGEGEDEAAAVSSGRENQGAAAAALAALQEGSPLAVRAVTPARHTTRPPPRYTEASLVRALEERGIGRPSTYAPIMSLLQERGYVAREGRALLPTSLGRVLTAFLERYFGGVVDYDFTSDMEGRLDDIASGKAAWRPVLSSFWGPFQSAVAAMGAVRTTQVFDDLDSDLEYFLFPRRPAAAAAAAAAAVLPAATDGSAIDVAATAVAAPTAPAAAGDADGAVAAPAAAPVALSDPRVCPKCGVGRLVLKPSRFGGFIGCSMFADEKIRCGYGRPLLPVVADGAEGGSADVDGESNGGAAAAAATERLLGQHPETGEPVYVKLGPYGLYVQLGESATEPAGDKKKKKKATKAKKAKTKAKAGEVVEEAEEVEDVEAAAAAVSKPKRAGIPKAKGLTLHGVTLDAALALLALPRHLGPHPEDGQPVVANTGPFGPYVAHGGVSASLGKRATPQDVDLDLALQLLAAKRARAAEREARGLPPRGGRRSAVSSSAKSKSKAKSKAAPKATATATATGRAKAATGSKAAAASAAAPAMAPKASAYTTFLRQRWAAEKAADPGASYREAVSRIAAEWRELGEAGQRRFADDGAAAADPGPPNSTGVGKAPRPKAKASSSSPSATARTGAGKAPSAAAAAAAAVAEAEGPAAGAKPRSGGKNPFMAFCAERRAAVRAAHPGASVGEVAKLLGAEWRALSEDYKAAYR